MKIKTIVFSCWTDCIKFRLCSSTRRVLQS